MTTPNLLVGNAHHVSGLHYKQGRQGIRWLATPLTDTVDTTPKVREAGTLQHATEQLARAMQSGDLLRATASQYQFHETWMQKLLLNFNSPFVHLQSYNSFIAEVLPNNTDTQDVRKLKEAYEKVTHLKEADNASDESNANRLQRKLKQAQEEEKKAYNGADFDDASSSEPDLVLVFYPTKTTETFNDGQPDKNEAPADISPFFAIFLSLCADREEAETASFIHLDAENCSVLCRNYYMSGYLRLNAEVFDQQMFDISNFPLKKILQDFVHEYYQCPVFSVHYSKVSETENKKATKLQDLWRTKVKELQEVLTRQAIKSWSFRLLNYGERNAVFEKEKTKSEADTKPFTVPQALFTLHPDVRQGESPNNSMKKLERMVKTQWYLMQSAKEFDAEPFCIQFLIQPELSGLVLNKRTEYTWSKQARTMTEGIALAFENIAGWVRNAMVGQEESDVDENMVREIASTHWTAYVADVHLIAVGDQKVVGEQENDDATDDEGFKDAQVAAVVPPMKKMPESVLAVMQSARYKETEEIRNKYFISSYLFRFAFTDAAFTDAALINPTPNTNQFRFEAPTQLIPYAERFAQYCQHNPFSTNMEHNKVYAWFCLYCVENILLQLFKEEWVHQFGGLHLNEDLDYDLCKYSESRMWQVEERQLAELPQGTNEDANRHKQWNEVLRVELADLFCFMQRCQQKCVNHFSQGVGSKTERLFALMLKPYNKLGIYVLKQMSEKTTAMVEKTAEVFKTKAIFNDAMEEMLASIKTVYNKSSGASNRESVQWKIGRWLRNNAMTNVNAKYNNYDDKNLAVANLHAKYFKAVQSLQTFLQDDTKINGQVSWPTFLLTFIRQQVYQEENHIAQSLLELAHDLQTQADLLFVTATGKEFTQKERTFYDEAFLGSEQKHVTMQDKEYWDMNNLVLKPKTLRGLAYVIACDAYAHNFEGSTTNVTLIIGKDTADANAALKERRAKQLEPIQKIPLEHLCKVLKLLPYSAKQKIVSYRQDAQNEILGIFDRAIEILPNIKVDESELANLRKRQKIIRDRVDCSQHTFGFEESEYDKHRSVVDEVVAYLYQEVLRIVRFQSMFIAVDRHLPDFVKKKYAGDQMDAENKFFDAVLTSSQTNLENVITEIFNHISFGLEH